MSSLRDIRQRRAALRLDIAMGRLDTASAIAHVRQRADAAAAMLSVGRAAAAGVGRIGMRRVLIALATAAAAYIVDRVRGTPKRD